MPGNCSRLQVFAPHAGMLRLVVVPACDSGNVSDPGNHLGSVTQMLHGVGIPAVVDSCNPLSSQGSTQFAASFYGALVRARRDTPRLGQLAAVRSRGRRPGDVPAAAAGGSPASFGPADALATWGHTTSSGVIATRIRRIWSSKPDNVPQ